MPRGVHTCDRYGFGPSQRVARGAPLYDPPPELKGLMAASSGDDAPTQLAALLGCEVVRIRKTADVPPKVSLIDVAVLITGKHSVNATQGFLVGPAPHVSRRNHVKTPWVAGWGPKKWAPSPRPKEFWLDTHPTWKMSSPKGPRPEVTSSSRQIHVHPTIAKKGLCLRPGESWVELVIQ